MLPIKLPEGVRPIEEIVRLMGTYPARWREWCEGPERMGCACRGCIRQPSPDSVRGDPEYQPWPNEADALNKAEFEAYEAYIKDHPETNGGKYSPPEPKWDSLVIKARPRGKEVPWPRNFRYTSTGCTVQTADGVVPYEVWLARWERDGTDISVA